MAPHQRKFRKIVWKASKIHFSQNKLSSHFPKRIIPYKQTIIFITIQRSESETETECRQNESFINFVLKFQFTYNGERTSLLAQHISDLYTK